MTGYNSNNNGISSKSSTWDLSGKWTLITVVLGLLHLISLTWMVQMQLEITELRQLNRILHNKSEDSFVCGNIIEKSLSEKKKKEEEEEEDDALDKNKCKTIFKEQLSFICDKKVEYMPQALKHSSGKEGSNVLQLRGLLGEDGLGGSIKADKLDTSWTLDFPESYQNGDDLRFDKGTGCIEIMRSGHYFIYAQLQPEGVSKTVKFWNVDIEKVVKGKADVLLLASVKLCYHQSSGCGQGLTKTSMVVSVAKHLLEGEKVRIKVNEGTSWYSSTVVQTFGVFAV